MKLISVLLRTKYCIFLGLIWIVAASSLAAQEAGPVPSGSEQTFSGLSLITPTSLSQTNNLLGSGDTPPVGETTYQGKYDMIQITVSVSHYNADPKEQLSKDINEFMDKLKHMTGVTEVVHTIREVDIDGGFAKRVSLNMTRADKILRGQYLYVVRGNKIWCVQTIYPATTVQGDVIASGIIASVRLKGSETAALVR